MFDLAHTFVTSDHHFGSWKPDPTRRMLVSLIGGAVLSREAEDDAIDNWNAVVGQNDLVIYAGDFHDCGLADLIEYRKRLNGRINLVKGNHDFLPDAVYEAVFDQVCEELWIEELGLVVRHCPDPDETAARQIFGHVHRGTRAPFVSRRSFCSCATRNGCRPVSLADAFAAMDASEDFRLNLEA